MIEHVLNKMQTRRTDLGCRHLGSGQAAQRAVGCGLATCRALLSKIGFALGSQSVSRAELHCDGGRSQGLCDATGSHRMVQQGVVIIARGSLVAFAVTATAAVFVAAASCW